MASLAAESKAPQAGGDGADLEDSNMAGIGGAEDKAARKAAAEGEEAWVGAGTEVGVQVWRIEKFQVVAWPVEEYGNFYTGDSYIVLSTYKEADSDKLLMDIHFWLGTETTQDEMGTAAYKTVELDDHLGGEPVQHREVQGYESSLFLSYFKKTGGIQLLEGGIESGFNKVKPESYKPRLLHLKGRKNIRVEEVPIHLASLNSGDVFILDAGLEIFQWQGKSAGKNEKARGGQLCRAIDDERRGKPEVYVFRQGDSDEQEFLKFFGVTDGEKPTIADDTGDDAEWEKDSDKRLYKLSDSSGKLEFTLVAEKTVKKSMLDSSDVFVFDIGSEIFAWVGKGASKDEKRGAMQYAQEYLKEHKRPPMLPITKLLEGANADAFNSSFDKE